MPLVVLKALAYEDRMEPKDAYYLIFVLFHHPLGPEGVGELFAQKMEECPEEPLWTRALEILRSRFLSDESIQGVEKDGPVSYARFTQPDSPQEQAIARQDAVAVVTAFLGSVESSP